MKRNPRKVKWTKVYRALQGKDLCNDTVFQFERRRNRPLIIRWDLYLHDVAISILFSDFEESPPDLSFARGLWWPTTVAVC